MFEIPDLHDRDELDIRGVELISQEAIDIERTRGVETVHAGECVKPHTESAQQLRRSHHLVECRRTTLVNAVMIMQFPRSIDAQTYEEPMLLEEFCPFLVQQDAICLQIVLDALTG